MDFSTMSNDDLTAALNEANAQAKTLFALSEPTIEQVDEAEKVLASIQGMEAEQATRAAAVADAAKRFAAARSTFSAEPEVEESDEDAEAEESDEDAETDTEEEAEEAESDTDDTESEADVAESETEAVTTASAVNHTKAQRVSAASTVGRKTKRPTVKAADPVTITAAADVPGFSTGSKMDGMGQVTKALINRAKGFSPFNLSAARAVRSQSGGQEVLSKFGVASFGLDFSDTLTASKGNDYNAVRSAIKGHGEALTASINSGGGSLTAAGWCAPSEPVYTYIADYVVDGIATVPEVNAPRGGLLLTTGPSHVTQGAALDDFGFDQTEAEAEAGKVKTCETIECPEFEDHRLDATGYCFKIPILTQKAYPELITDALRLAGVLYAHKMNRRVIRDMVALSDAVTFTGYGASFTDALEALAVLATKERRKWNIGENAIMEIKVPVWVREVFRADMSRRTGLALTDVATDQKIAAEFAARRFAVEYVADWQELTGANIVYPGTFEMLVYPAGTFVKAVEDVINLSAVYDAASLSVNEYTGVFFEQGYMLAKAGYGASRLTIPVNTAGRTGANDLGYVADAA